LGEFISLPEDDKDCLVCGLGDRLLVFRDMERGGDGLAAVVVAVVAAVGRWVMSIPAGLERWLFAAETSRGRGGGARLSVGGRSGESLYPKGTGSVMGGFVSLYSD